MSADDEQIHAPGWPGIPARWTSSAKSGVGTSLSAASRVWFTLSHGILNEIYFPRIDRACTRDLGFIVTDGARFFSEEKRHTRSAVTTLGDGVPAYRIVNTCTNARYEIEKTILTDPRRDVLLQRVTFRPLVGKAQDYRVYALLAPHLDNRGSGNTACVCEYKGVPILAAERDGRALALVSSAGWERRSAGFVGVSDGWQDLAQHGLLTWTYTRAENGNVALVGELDPQAAGRTLVLALGFGLSIAEAAHHAITSLHDGFDSIQARYVGDWQTWHAALSNGDLLSSRRRMVLTSAALLRTHEEKQFDGGVIASLSIPWGSSKGDDDLGGYHLVWPRDLVEAGGALLAAGQHASARRVVRYLEVTQEEDGHWSQNMWLDGTAYWNGVQMDETALPILLADLAFREGALGEHELKALWPMMRRAASFLVRNGPVTPEDRWEEDPGYSPFTLAAEIAALLVAADLADRIGEPGAGRYLRETADTWNANIERWTYVCDTDLARRCGAEGYYVRIAPPETAEGASLKDGFVPIKNRPPNLATAAATQIVSPDALALVRFGLRAPDDPRIVSSVKVVDALLKVDTPYGPCWRRYNGDGYGEHEDGSAFDGTGIGRPWPLLTAERAHYELAAGRRDTATALSHAVEAFAGDSGLIPEQIWDAADLPDRELWFGRASGSARPLVWAHAEYIKLCRSIKDGRVFDQPRQTYRRYVLGEANLTPLAVWRLNNKVRTLAAGRMLRLEVPAPALVHWSADGWLTSRDSSTIDSGFGLHFVDLPTGALTRGARVHFTFYWSKPATWEQVDYAVTVE